MNRSTAIPLGTHIQPTEQVTLRACLVWGLAALFYFYDYFLQVSPSAMKPELSMAFAREAEQFGSLAAYYLYAYGLMQIPVGLLMDKFGPRRLITLACVLCASGSLWFGLANTLWEAKAGRLLMGLGASFAVVSCLKIASLWFPPKRFALLTGMMVTIGMLGAVVGLAPVSYAVELIGWRETMRVGAFIGGALSILLWLIVRDTPQQAVGKAARSSLSVKELFCGLFEVIKNPQTWIASIYAGLMFVPTLAFGGLWGIPFLVEAHGFARETAGWVVSLIFIGWACGGPFYGWFSDYIGRRNRPMHIANLTTFALCLAIIYLTQIPVWLTAALFFLLGFCSSGFIIAFAVVRESNRPEISGTAMGFVNALNTVGGALAQPIIGKILDMNSRLYDKSPDMLNVFTLPEYQHALLALPGCLFVAWVTLFFLRETFCHTAYKK